MIPLHTIQSALQHYVWALPRGRNSRQLGINRAYWDRPIYHAYMIERGTPPPPDQRDRRYWAPYYIPWPTRDYVITPLCGVLRTQSREPSLQWGNGRWGEIADINQCPECRARANNIEYIDRLRQNDPWSRMNGDERMLQPDPVTGG